MWQGAALILAGTIAGSALAEGLPEPLTAMQGDPIRGREIVVDRQVGLCLLCHSGPFPDVPFQGDLAPDLTGTGDRLDAASLRQRMVDSRAINPQTIMPPYYSLDGLTRVGAVWEDTTILDAQQIEDVVAFLTTLKEEAE